MAMLDLSILIGGEAGQGVQTVGEVLSRILIRSGFFVFSIQDYHSRIRGGHNFTQIRFSGQPVGALSEKIDILVCLNQETYDLHFSSVKDSGVILGSFSPFHAELSIVRFIPLDFEKIAQEVGNKLYANMVAIGTLMGVLGLDQAVALSYVDELLGKKGEDIAGANKRALGKGLSSIQLINNPVLLDRKTFPEKNPHLFILTGNEALGLGAICAGCTFYSAYPMTPSTGIMNYVATRASKYGILVEQAEDEIAAINMAIGASFAGARSMTATSGGGFCLMTEGLGLAAMTETPIVVVEAQRPGPSTGLPTRTSQGDLEFVLSASQDEFPRFVFAPRDPQNAIDVMVRAFNLTDRFQVPAIVLSDQYLADSAWTFQDLSLQEDGVSLQVSSALDDYRRYVITGDGISPRALPGEGNGVVIFDSDEHDEFGH
ncbi:MAG: 2-oxoacid:acceptor oxidoreductase subunit alpha [Candidatus Atribacteria bacterium]|nr:2-oxoacid:acceptor oxidoreductase subunit alpha [Candidatus Atribacteria bacterium]